VTTTRLNFFTIGNKDPGQYLPLALDFQASLCGLSKLYTLQLFHTTLLLASDNSSIFGFLQRLHPENAALSFILLNNQ